MIADAICDLLNRSGESVVKKNSISKDNREGRSRPVSPGDIGVLVRRRNNAVAIADQLRNRGFEVSMMGSGLLGTPEAVLAMACL